MPDQSLRVAGNSCAGRQCRRRGIVVALDALVVVDSRTGIVLYAGEMPNALQAKVGYCEDFLLAAARSLSYWTDAADI